MTTSRLIAAALCFAFLCAGCAERIEGTEPDPNYDVLMSAGKQSLEDGRGDLAYLRFIEAERLRPDDPAASFGLLLSDAQQLVHFADEFVNLLSAFSPDSAGASAKTLPEDNVANGMEPGTGRVVAMFLDLIFDDFLDEMVIHAEAAVADPDLQFEVGAVPLSFADQTLLTFNGDWTRDDIVLLAGSAHMLRAFMDMLLSVDLNFDIAALLDFLKLDAASLPEGEYFDRLIEMVQLFLTDPRYPNFLLANHQADTRMPRAGIQWGYFCDHTAWSLSHLDDAAGPVGFTDVNGNGVREKGEPVRLGDLDPTSDSLTPAVDVLIPLMEMLAASFWDYTDLDIDPDASNAVDLSELNDELPDDGIFAFLQLPETSIDVGAFFRNPDAAALKGSISGVVDCLSRPLSLVPMLICLTS